MIEKFTHPLLIARTVLTQSGIDFLLQDKKVSMTIDRRFARRLIECADGLRSEQELINELAQEWDARAVNEVVEYLKDQGILCNSHDLTSHLWTYIANPSLFSHALQPQQIVDLIMESCKRNAALSDISICGNVTRSSLVSLLERRRSVRSFSSKSVDTSYIIKMLWAGYGKIDSHINGPNYNVDRHTVPSSGALFPLKLSLITQRGNGDLPAGVYRVEFDSYRNVHLAKTNIPPENMRKCLVNQLDVFHVQGFIIISGTFRHNARKYANRSLPYVLLEAGHAAQNIHLAALEDTVATLEMGGYFDESLKRFLSLPEDYQPLIAIAFGYESSVGAASYAVDGLEVRWAELYSGNYQLPFHMAFATPINNRNAADWSCGRSQDPIVAFRKAVAETEEREANGTLPDLVFASWKEVAGQAIDPRTIVKYYERQYHRKSFPFTRFDEKKRYQWTWGIDMATQEKRLILTDEVYYPYDPPYDRYTATNSSGSAAYPTLDGAIERGTLELIEREAFLVTWANAITPSRIRIASLPQNNIDRITLLEKEGFDVSVVCVDYLMPTFIWIARNSCFSIVTVAACTSFSVGEALDRSLMELEASVYCTLKKGSTKASMRPRDVRRVADHGLLYEQPENLSRVDFLLQGEERAFCEIMPRYTSWDSLMHYFAQHNLRVYFVRLTRATDTSFVKEIEVVKVIIPGLVPMSFGYGTEPCGMERLYRVPIEAGYRTSEKTFSELNLFPHPFT